VEASWVEGEIVSEPRAPSHIQKAHPPQQIIGNLKERVTRSSRSAHISCFSNSLFVALFEPRDIGHALFDSSWVNAMHEELKNFERNHVWTLVDPSRDVNVIGTKFCCCVDFAIDVCRILLWSFLPAPRALACSQVSSLRFLLPRFFLLVILSASVCFSSWQQGSTLLFTTVPHWEIILRSGSAFWSPLLALRRCSSLSSSVVLASPFSCHITSSILFMF
jgi:hypothetical protein